MVKQNFCQGHGNIFYQRLKKLCVVRLHLFKLKKMQNLQNLSFFPSFISVCVCGGGGSFYNRGCGGRTLTIDNE